MEQNPWYDEAKLTPPSHAIKILNRASLIETLHQTASKRLVHLSAPAGFGKSTLLLDFYTHRANEHLPTVWINLDENDRSLDHLFSYIVLGLDNAGCSLDRIALAAATNPIRYNKNAAITEEALSIVRGAKLPVLIILDDYHLVRNDEIDSLILEFSQRADGMLTFTIISRDGLPATFSQLLMSNEAIELNAADLRFSNEEVQAAFDYQITESQVEQLQTKVEGWPAAIQLARILLQNSDNYEESIAQFHGYSGQIAVYLIEQVMSQLTSEQYEFIIKTSVLKSFGADLADAVCDRHDSQRILRELEPLGALIIPIDNSLKTFRYHHLLAECAQDLLDQKLKGEKPDLHLRAAKHLSNAGSYREAVRHAAKAKRFDVCADIICAAGAWELILFGGIGYLSDLLSEIPEPVLDDYPRLQIAYAYLQLKRGNPSESRVRLKRAENSSAFSGDDEACLRDYTNVKCLVGVYEDDFMLNRALPYMSDIASYATSKDSISTGIYRVCRFIACMGSGQLEQADVEAKLAIDAYRESGSVTGINFCTLHIGLSAFYRGDYALAHIHFEKARAMSEDNFSADNGLKHACDVHMNALNFWTGKADAGTIDVLQIALEYSSQYDGWFELYLLGFDAYCQSALLVDDFDQAMHVVDRMKIVAQDRAVERLSHIARCFQLIALTKAKDSRNAALIFEEMKPEINELLMGSERQSWMVKFFTAMAAAHYSHSLDRHAESIRLIQRSIDIADGIGADFFSVRAQLEKSVLLDQAHRREDAIEALEPALIMACRTPLKQPFFTQSASRLLRAARLERQFANSDEHMLISAFVTEVLSSKSVGENFFTDRELQVLDQLGLGRSNKEIARAIDMTENTVKFHMKNIFAKLDVTNRVQAVTQAKTMNFIE